MLPARVAYFGLLFQGAGKTGLVLFRAIITLFMNAVITYFLVLKFGMAGAAGNCRGRMAVCCSILHYSLLQLYKYKMV